MAIEVIALMVAGLTAVGIWATWWQGRDRFRLIWGEPEVGYQDSPVPRWAMIRVEVEIVNQSSHPDAIREAVFEMRRPQRITAIQRTWTGEPGFQFLFGPDAPNIALPPYEARRIFAKLELYEPEHWANSVVEGHICLYTARRRFRFKLVQKIPSWPALEVQVGGQIQSNDSD